MAIYSYRLASGQTRWMFTIDLPPAADGRRRQMNRKGFVSQEAAHVAETEARTTYARADLGADGSFAAELEIWLGERELDVQWWSTMTCRATIHGRGDQQPSSGRPATAQHWRPSRSAAGAFRSTCVQAIAAVNEERWRTPRCHGSSTSCGRGSSTACTRLGTASRPSPSCATAIGSPGSPCAMR